MGQGRIEWHENHAGDLLVWLVADDQEHALIVEGMSLAHALRELARQLDDAEVPALDIEWDGGPTIEGHAITHQIECGDRVYLFTATTTYRARRK